MAPRVRAAPCRETHVPRAARPRPRRIARQTNGSACVWTRPGVCTLAGARVPRAKVLCSQRRESRGTISRRHMRRHMRWHASSCAGVRQGVRRPRGGTLALLNRCKLAADGSHSSWQLHRWALQPWRREAATRAHGCERVDRQGRTRTLVPAAATGQHPRSHRQAPAHTRTHRRHRSRALAPRERERVAALERLSLGGSSSAART